MRKVKNVIVYLVRNKLSGKCYVGKTTRVLSERWHEHIRDARNQRKSGVFYDDLRKLGVGAFEISVLGEADCQRRLNQIERKYIRRYDAVNSGYNQSAAAHGGRPKRRASSIYTLPQSQREKIAESVRAYRAQRKQAAA